MSRVHQEVLTQNKDREKQLLQNIKLNYTSVNELDEEETKLNQLVLRGSAKPEDKIKANFIRICQRFPTYYPQLTYPDIQYLKKLMSALFKMKWYIQS